ncbi:spike glycoprotein [Tai Forest ebolavirus]|uniref:Envelope glycoprotein n=1 Tax=Tai Forest ebolavirus TaxID=186541 RepID=B8XCN9_9MONO|nr:spike glycoprotein [Tai Forest ebolavirus]ACI28632.1 spike glycoprotein precursor [Tai Forest ebolavirus]
MGASGILQLPRERFRKTSFFVWVIILFHKVFSIPLGVVHNNTLQVSDIDKFVCRDKLSSTSQLKSVGLNLEGNGVATDVPTATKRWGFRAGVPPKVVNCEAGEWAENCYNLAIKKVDGSECLPEAPEGVRDFPRCRYVHKVSGTGPCPGGLAFHKEGAFFLYDRLASTIIYRGTTFAEGVIAFLILPKARKDFFQSPPLHEPANMTTDPSSYYHTTTINYVVDNFGTNTTEFLFQVDHLTYVQLEARFTPQFLVLLNETIYSDNRRSNTTGKLIWKINPTVDTSMGEWAFWENKKNFTKTLSSEELSFVPVPETQNQVLDTTATVSPPISAHNHAAEDHKELVSEDSTPVVQMQNIKGKDTMPTTVTGVPTTTPSPFPINARNTDHTKSFIGLEGPQEDHSTTQPAKTTSQPTNSTESTTLNPTSEPSSRGTGPSSPTVPNTTESHAELGKTTPTTLPEQHTAASAIPRAVHPDELSGPGFLTNTIRGVTNLLTGSRRKRRDVTPNTQPKCNPNLHYWTALDEGAAIGLAWIPYFGPAAEGIYTEGIMENQNGLICGLRQLANETTQALQLFLRATTELRTFSILNRKAIDFLLQRWGGTCHILGPDCCIEPQDWTKNITDKIDQIIHDFVDNNLPNQNDGSNWWTGWKQWVPAGIGITGVIIAIIALLCICKFML